MIEKKDEAQKNIVKRECCKKGMKTMTDKKDKSSKHKYDNLLLNGIILIDIILLSISYPILVPKYLSEGYFVIAYLTFVGITGLIMRYTIIRIRKRKD